MFRCNPKLQYNSKTMVDRPSNNLFNLIIIVVGVLLLQGFFHLLSPVIQPKFLIPSMMIYDAYIHGL